MFRLIFALLMTLSLAACVTTKPDPAAFATAEEAIAAAERAGAAELAPMELRFAREKLDAARRGMDSKQFDISYWLIEESEINSELAIEKSRTTLAQRKANELRRENEVMREEFIAEYGEDFE
jgi:hypothetical protein